MRTCTMNDCSKTHVARGLCGTHYNQQHQPDRHAAKETACIMCGAKVMRSSGGGRRYGATCSDLCRTRVRTGWSEELPEDHPARWYGATCAWTPPPPPKIPLPRFTTGQCAECELWFTAETNGSPIANCSRVCAQRAIKRRRRAREHNAPGDFTYGQLIRLWAAFDRACAYCGTPTHGQPDPDHVVPLSRGGHNDLSNLLPACRSCNADKSDLTLEEWKTDRDRRGLTPVRTAFHPDDRRFWHLVLREPTAPAWRHRAAGDPR